MAGTPADLGFALEAKYAECCIGCNTAHFKLQPLVEPQPSQT